MANKTGLTTSGGKLYINGQEVGGGGSANNTFNKIVVLGTSIEATQHWPQYMASKLGMSFFHNVNGKTSGVISYALGGGQVCWSGEDYPMYYGGGENIVDITTYDDAVLGGFSCSQAERTAAIEYYTDVERWTIDGTYVGIGQDRITTANNNHYENICYDNSLLNNLDADLFIFGTYGINDRPSTRLTFTDSNGNTCKTSTIRNDGTMQLDRRTIFGAYNYVLKALYQANPNAKVVILGQHTRQWADQNIVNALQMSVADFWRIPFADWGNFLPFNGTWSGATPEGANHQTKTLWNTDVVHPSARGAQIMGTWVADWITKTELTQLNPRWELE